MTEFVEIINTKGLYQINKEGYVKRVAATIKRVRLGKNETQFVAERIMTTPVGKIGYKVVTLCVNGKQKVHYIHRLLAQAFIPNPEDKPQVNHIDGDKLNCNLSNLEWVERRENIQHAYDTGLRVNKKGEHSPMYGKFKGIKSPHFGRKGENALNGRTKLVLDFETGIYYHGVQAAADAKGYKKGTLGAMLCGSDRNHTRLSYV